MNKQPIVARPFHYICHIPFLVRTERVSSIHLNNRRLHHVCRWRSDRRKLDRMNRLKDCFDGDELLDNVDLCKLLNVTDRTLARYRSKKLIKYYIIDRRIYYRSSEVREFMKAQGMKR